MLVPSQATTLSTVPEFIDLENYLSTSLNLRNGSRSMDRILELCEYALYAFRRSLNISNNRVGIDIVNMENSTERTVVGVIVRGKRLKSFYDNRFHSSAQLHVDSTMCVVSWNTAEVRKGRNFPSLVNLGLCPAYIPDILSDDKVFFNDSDLLTYFKHRANNYVPVDKERNFSEFQVTMHKAFLTIKSSSKNIRNSELVNMATFISSFVVLLEEKTLGNYPQKIRLTESWVNKSVLEIKADMNNLPIVFAMVKRCFYILCKEGFIL